LHYDIPDKFISLYKTLKQKLNKIWIQIKVI